MESGPSIVRVCVDSPLPHLDRPFDYSVPPRLRGVVRVGTRVRVPFHGRLIVGIVVDEGEAPDFRGSKSDIRSAGLVPSTTASGIDLAQRVARRYGGSLWEVLRLAIPPRVASVERRWAVRLAEGNPARGSELSQRLAAAVEILDSVAGEDWPPTAEKGSPLRLVWEAVPEPERRTLPLRALLAPVVQAAAQGSVLLVVPDARAVSAALEGLERIGLRKWRASRGGEVAVLHAESGPTARYENYLAAMSGAAPIVVGTRPVVFQPVPALALLTMWADGSTAFEDPHSPHPHARTVAALRSEVEGADLLLGSWAPSLEAAALVDHGWMGFRPAPRTSIRTATPVIEVSTDRKRAGEGPRGRHWMPSNALKAIREGLDRGPVFVLVPRAGYVRALACARCGSWARCPACDEGLSLPGPGQTPLCTGCDRAQPDWHCPDCHSASLAESRQGVVRIAEQIHRMVPGPEVHLSAASAGVLADGSVGEGIVVSSPGALPSVPEGYAAGVIVGADSGLGRARTEVDAATLWFHAASLVRPRGSSGRVVVVGDLEPAVERALETWTPGELAREAARERAVLGLPPFGRPILVRGEASLVDEARTAPIRGKPLNTLSEVTEVSRGEGEWAVLCERSIAQEAVDALRALAVEASAAGRGRLTIRVDGPLPSPR